MTSDNAMDKDELARELEALHVVNGCRTEANFVEVPVDLRDRILTSLQGETDSGEEDIVAALSPLQRQTLLEGCACGTADEMVALGLWTPCPKVGKPYYDVTPLGHQALAILKATPVTAPPTRSEGIVERLRHIYTEAELLALFPDGHVVTGDEHDLVIRQVAAQKELSQNWYAFLRQAFDELEANASHIRALEGRIGELEASRSALIEAFRADPPKVNLFAMIAEIERQALENDNGQG